MCHMCHTQELYLNDNEITDAGVTALANACAGGAMAQLCHLYLRENPVSDNAKHTLQAIMSQRSGTVHF